LMAVIWMRMVNHLAAMAGGASPAATSFVRMPAIGCLSGGSPEMTR
jgi:hypothetical protein